MTIEYSESTQTATLHSPLEDFEEVSVDVTIREDPLTGRQTRLADGSFVMPEEDPDIDHIIDDTDGCFFCPGTVESATPTYADVDMERGSVGEAVSFPNLNPYGGHSNVIAITKDHYASPAEFTAAQLRDGFIAAIDYIDAVQDSNPAAEFAAINMNFLRPAGSSIIHPHMQTIVDDRGTTKHRRLLAAARTFTDENERAYWSAAVTDAQNAGRYIGSTTEVDWIAPYAPHHHRHVRGVCLDPPAATADLAPGLGAGLENVLSAYAAEGFNSFNFVVFVSPSDPAFPPIVDVIARSVFDQYYWSDSPFFTILHDEAVIDTPPETYATPIAEHF